MRRRKSYFVYEVAIAIVLMVVIWRYGGLAGLGVLTSELMAYCQGLDRGADLARSSQ